MALLDDVPNWPQIFCLNLGNEIGEGLIMRKSLNDKANDHPLEWMLRHAAAKMESED
jgi:hypothetical protein